MKVYISADIEGVTGIAHWDEARKPQADYAEFREQMTREVAAACRGAIRAGAGEILIKDAHATGRNLTHRDLPSCVRMVRGWAGHPMGMIQELDESFAAVFMIGYHSHAGSGGNPLAHTYSGRIAAAELDGRDASEFLLYGTGASRVGAPVALVSGDEALCAQVREVNEAIRTVVTGRGVGDSMVAEHPDATVERLEKEAEQALRGDLGKLVLPGRDRYRLRLRYKEPKDAFRAAQYPGMQAEDDTTVVLEAADYLEILRAILFVH